MSGAASFTGIHARFSRHADYKRTNAAMHIRFKHSGNGIRATYKILLNVRTLAPQGRGRQ
jgi:hypothetical protein